MWISASAQQRFDRRRASVPNRPVERGDTAESCGIWIGTNLEQVLDHLPLPTWVPVARPGDADGGGMQWLRAAPVPRMHVGIMRDETPSRSQIVRERCSVQRSVAGVDLGMAHRDEELLPTLELHSPEPRHLPEQLVGDDTFVVRYGLYQ